MAPTPQAVPQMKQKVLEQCPAQSEYSGGVTKRAHWGPLRGEAPQTEPVWKYKQITLPSLCTQSQAGKTLSPLMLHHRRAYPLHLTDAETQAWKS